MEEMTTNQPTGDRTVRMVVKEFQERYKTIEKKVEKTIERKTERRNEETGETETIIVPETVTDIEHEVVPVHWALISPAGQEQRMARWERVQTLIELPDFEERGMDATGYAAQVARDQAQYVSALYQNWKAGEGIDVDGTPLAACNGISSEQAKRIRMAGIHTMEDLATASGNRISRIALPNAHQLKDTARRFLAMVGQSAAGDKLKRLEEDNEMLRSEIEEMKGMLRQAIAAQPSSEVTDEQTVEVDEEFEALKDLARENGIKIGRKSKETLERELEELQPAEAA